VALKVNKGECNQPNVGKKVDKERKGNKKSREVRKTDNLKGLHVINI